MISTLAPTGTAPSSGMTEACVKGAFVDAGGVRRTFFGCDSIRTVQ